MTVKAEKYEIYFNTRDRHMREFKGKLLLNWQMIVFQSDHFSCLCIFFRFSSSDYEYSFLQNITKRKTVSTNSERIKHFSYETREILSFSAIYLICWHLSGGSVQRDAMEILCVWLWPQVCVGYLNRYLAYRVEQRRYIQNRYPE